MREISPQRYRELLYYVNDAVYTVDLATYTFTFVNPAAVRLTGYPEEEFLTLDISKVVVAEYLPLVQKMIAEKLQADVGTLYEIEIVQKNGARVPVELSSRAVYENGRAVEILGVARDISERKMLEHQKEIFVSLISHEIKNPLTSMKAYIDIWKRKYATEPKVLEQFVSVDNQIGKINRLVSDFLEVNKIELGTFTVQKEEFDLNKAIDATVRNYSNEKYEIVREGNVEYKVMGDETRICQVMDNLISNAIRYSPHSNRVVVGVREEPERVVVWVKDFGMGIAKQDMYKVFELFYRVSSRGDVSIKGYGLGLYICREIVRAHGGDIWGESELGKGSTFFFSLPR